ncbi:unnamed protein product [marine sediment metagenome]|uniref:Uncharacterized protein n=1 Tax=marine sediment metagenome TaxID=412755 RepID=X1FBM3_9ZZZZ
MTENEEYINKIIQKTGLSKKDLWKFYELGINKLILGTETILSMKIIENALDIFKQRDIIVSIDLKKNKLLTQSQELKNLSPFHFIKQIQKFGVLEVILLDLSRVGKKQEISLENFSKSVITQKFLS